MRGRFGAIFFGIFGLFVIGITALWNFKNREMLSRTFGADVEFVTSPQSIPAGEASRFVVRVAQEKENTPLAGRVMDVIVSPMDKAQIITVSGKTAASYATEGTRAKGRTDSLGNLTIVVRASEPGKYTLVATDSVSAREGSTNFNAVAPGG